MDSKFQRIIDEGYTFSMDKYMGEGWELFKKGAGSYIGYVLVCIVIYFGMIFIPILNLFLLLFVPMTLAAGFFTFSRALSRGNNVFGRFFDGFNHVGQIILMVLTVLLFLLPFLVIFFTFLFPSEIFSGLLTNNLDPEEIGDLMSSHMMDQVGWMFLVQILYYIVIFYIYTSYVLTLPLIVDSKLGFWDAMETSRKVVAKKFFSFLLMGIVMSIIIMLGIFLTCGLGTLVVIPFTFTTIFAMYDNILKPESDEIEASLESFGQASIDSNTEN